MRSRIILLPGAFHGSWCYKYTIPYLAKLNHQYILVDYPRRFYPECAPTLDHYIEHTVNVIKHTSVMTPSLPLFVAGHSLGGLIGTNAIEMCHEHVSGMVFIAGSMLPNGESGKSFVHAANMELRQRAIELIHNNEWQQVKSQYAKEMFYNDCTDEQVRWAASQLVPEIIYAEFNACWTQQRFGRVPKYYIHAQKDQMILPAMQKKMTDALGLSVEDGTVMEMDTSHSPWLSQPEQLALHIDQCISHALRNI